MKTKSFNTKIEAIEFLILLGFRQLSKTELQILGHGTDSVYFDGGSSIGPFVSKNNNTLKYEANYYL